MKSKFNKGKNHRPLSKQVKVSLPEDYPWKVLGWLHTDLAAILTEDQNDLLKQIIRDRDLYSYELLGELWGLQNYSKSSAYDFEHISNLRARYQLAALLKKFRFETDKQTRIDNATKKFFVAEDNCRRFNNGDFQKMSFGETEHDAKVLTYARAYIEKVIGTACPTHDIVTKWSRHGPGSNLDTCGGQSNIYHKYSGWPYSCTSSALPYARFLIQSDKRWLGALENSYRSKNGINKTAILDMKVFWNNVFKVVPGNRITFVPKNAQTERSIAIEPAMNLMLQLGVDGFIRQRLKRWDVDLDDQSKNQRFAYQGSIIQGDDSYITLDMSAASDSISLKLCELLLPNDWYSYLIKLRSPIGDLNGKEISYEKISSMGNGYTFAIESLIFASLCYGAIRSMENSFDPKRDYCIFGDDIVVRKRHAAKVVRALNQAGFQLNLDKSFLDGPIKESCGTDWIQGRPVRPVYMSEIPSNVMELFVDINRLQRILKLRWGIESSHLIGKMIKWIPEQCRIFKGPYSDEDFDSYLHVPMPTGEFRNSVWVFTKLKRGLASSNAKDFLMRKLMHDLRGDPQPNMRLFNWRYKAESGKDLQFRNWKIRASAGGSRFTVYKNYSYTVGKSYSVADHWRSDYAELSLSQR